MRSRVALNLEGRTAAEAIVDDFLKRWPNLEGAALQSILAFAREHYLDGLVERLLGGERGKMLAGSESEAAPVELARFFRERGRAKQAEQTLRDYVAIEHARPEDQQPEVHVDAHRRVPYVYVANVLFTLQRGGLQKVGFVSGEGAPVPAPAS